MPKIVVLIAIMLIGHFFNASMAAQESKSSIQSLAFLSGCWESNDLAKRSSVSEQWMKPAGGMMLGVGRTVKNGRAVDYEFMRIEERGSEIFFTAKPKSSNSETPFRLIKLSNSEATFENPDHDFPQRVIYKRNGRRLTGRIEGINKGKFMGIDFPLTRTRCE